MCALFGVVAALCAVDLRAQSSGSSGRHWSNLWSTESTTDRLVFGVWSLHVHHLEDGWSNDSAVGLAHRSLFAATFATTHGGRAWIAGIERQWASAQSEPIQAMLGFRIGLVYGYDGELGWLADATPILPTAQPVVYVGLGPIGLEATYSWVVFSLAGSVRY